MKSLREYIKEANTKGTAIGHFNISNLEALHGIYNAAKELDLPVIIGVSEGEEEFISREMAVAMVKTIREKDNFPIFLNADHHYSFESVKKAIDAGFDSVIIDAVKLPFEENVSLTKKCVEYAKEISKKTGVDILVEAELGFIGQSSKILDKIPDGVSEETMTSPEEAKKFVDEAGIDMLAPSVGNIHGIITSGNPKLRADRVKEIKSAVGIPLVLHGGSGSSESDFVDCINAGINIIHINTEIRVAYRDAIKNFLIENPTEVAPYKFLQPGVKAVENIVRNKLKLFNKM